MPVTLTPRQRTQLIPAIVSLPMILQSVDTTSLSVALPTMAHDLGVNPLHLNLAITSYLLSVAAFLPLSSWLADRFGTRNVFRAAVVIFSLASISCGFADSLAHLVISRSIQGMAGAMMVPVARMIMLQLVPKTQLVRAMVWFSASAVIGPIIGPALGGVVVTYASWRWIFIANVPVAAAAFVLGSIFFVEERPETEVRKLDVVSFLLMGAALAGLVFGLETSGRGLLPVPVVVGLLLAGSVCLAAYLLHARISPNPAIDVSLLKYPTFRTSMAAGMLLRISIGAMPFLVPLMLQLGFGMSPLVAGMITLATSVGVLFTRLFLRLLLELFGFRRMMIIGSVFMGALYIVFGQFRPGMPEYVMFALLLIGGVSRSLIMTNLNTLGYAELPKNRLNRASTMASMAQQLSQSLGVSFAAAVLNATLLWRGTVQLGPSDFWPVFTAMAALPFLAAPFFIRLPSNAGEELLEKKGAKEESGA